VYMIIAANGSTEWSNFDSRGGRSNFDHLSTMLNESLRVFLSDAKYATASFF
jgi:hypothetical protein